MKKCPYCNSELADEMRFCIYCMRSLDDKKAVEKKRKRISFAVIAAAVSCAIFVAFAVFACVIIFSSKRPDNTVPVGSETADETKTSTESEISEPYGKDTNTYETTADIASDAETTDMPQTDGLTEDITDVRNTDEDTDGQISEYIPPATETDESDAETENTETNVPETEVPVTTIPYEPETTAHVHTEACQKWVVDKPYSPAVYEDLKVIDVPFSPAEYGEIPYESEDCYYRVYFWQYWLEIEGMEDKTFSSRQQFTQWAEENGAEIYWDNVDKYHNGDLNGGRMTIDGDEYSFGVEKYDYYTTVKYKYGIVKEEQPEVSHIEKVLVSPEQKEEGHYEYVCGY